VRGKGKGGKEGRGRKGRKEEGRGREGKLQICHNPTGRNNVCNRRHTPLVCLLRRLCVGVSSSESEASLVDRSLLMTRFTRLLLL